MTELTQAKRTTRRKSEVVQIRSAGSIDMHAGTPYTPVAHRLWRGDSSDEVPLALLDLSISERGHFPCADFKVKKIQTLGGIRTKLGLMFTEESHAKDPLFAKLSKADKARLAKYVVKALAARRARYDWQQATAEPAFGAAAVPKDLNLGPNAYAMGAEGNCLSPHFAHGDTLVVDPDQKPVPGDFVAVWWKSGERQPSIKRLTMALPLADLGASSDFEAMLVVEQLNPPKRFGVPMSRVEAVHKVLGKADATLKRFIGAATRSGEQRR